MNWKSGFYWLMRNEGLWVLSHPIVSKQLCLSAVLVCWPQANSHPFTGRHIIMDRSWSEFIRSSFDKCGPSNCGIVPIPRMLIMSIIQFKYIWKDSDSATIQVFRVIRPRRLHWRLAYVSAKLFANSIHKTGHRSCIWSWDCEMNINYLGSVT